jgi:hypothetical protein
VTAPATDTELLTRLVRTRLACLVQLRDMGRRQLALIERADITGLLDVLVVKQRPLAELQQIERALAPFRAERPDERRWPTPADRAACAQLLRECDALLGEILAQEQRCEATLAQRRDEAARRLHGLHAAGQAHGAYAAAVPPAIPQLDLLSER